jgi:hypothetical protein
VSARQGKVLMVTIDENGNLAAAAVPSCHCPVEKPPVLKRHSWIDSNGVAVGIIR